MIWCNLAYGAMDSRDYSMFDFYRKSGAERNDYLTKRRYFKLIKKFDWFTFSRLIIKANAYKEYADFIHRDWLLIDSSTNEDDIKGFIRRYGKVLVKPNTGEQGQGIFKATEKDLKKIKELLNCGSTFIMEEVLENCDEIKVINPTSLNTFRAVTLVGNDDKVHILTIVLRCGCANSNVDNWGAGGIGYKFNVDNGICDCYGRDKKCNPYIFHPSSNVKMIGFQIPRYDELISYIIKLAAKNPKARYVGWDIALTPKGFELIEMNFPCGHDMMQSFDNPVYKTIKKYWK